jgi:cytochrome c556
VAILLWLAGAGLFTWMFVQGMTAPTSDGRTEVLLAPAERDEILAEMRQLLQALDGILDGVTENDRTEGVRKVAEAARAAGMHMAADGNPVLMAKLPLPFKQMGMSVHKDFDGLAERAAKGLPTDGILRELSGITKRCTTCHGLYRLAASR